MYTIKANINDEIVSIRFVSIYPDITPCINEKFSVHGLDAESVKIIKSLFDNKISFGGDIVGNRESFEIINCHFEDVHPLSCGEATLRVGFLSSKED